MQDIDIPCDAIICSCSSRTGYSRRNRKVCLLQGSRQRQVARGIYLHGTSKQVTEKAAGRWMRTLISSLWSYSKEIWDYRNAVVHGKTEAARKSKEMASLKQLVVRKYNEKDQDPHCIPCSRNHLFVNPLEATLSMDRDTLVCWLASVNEAQLTATQRLLISSKQKRNTLLHYFPYKTTNESQHESDPSWIFCLVFSTSHYVRAEGRAKAVTASKLRKLGVRRACTWNKKTKRPGKLLKDYRFVKREPAKCAAKERSQSEAEAMKTEFSGTLLSTAP
jgi:hypothetical protein